MGLKQLLKRKAVKTHRKVFGKTKEVMITTGKGGLTKEEIKGVLATLSTARKQGKIPALSYEHRPTTFIDRREPIFLTPKTVSVATARAKIKAVIRAKYGSKYIVA